jgi:hypothetical protein
MIPVEKIGFYLINTVMKTNSLAQIAVRILYCRCSVIKIVTESWIKLQIKLLGRNKKTPKIP